ncbi:hypothetical protein P5673_011187 [Acropora cervicornis]|uniref:MICOS complex subunit MIC13 n=1 Tax=Acropora cervicornis TaxID=6130 RepID=A0AAD9QQH0_ACRCE|nr:hypothetical protein P5673_011187 [Acropora cervicornis]
MAFTTVKVAVKLTVGGLALYGLSEILSSQDDTMKHMPTQTKIKQSWNSGVQRAFSGLEQAPQTAWELGTRGAHSAKTFIQEQLK